MRMRPSRLVWIGSGGSTWCQQRRSIVQGILRGDVTGPGRAAVGGESVRSDERDAGRVAGDASAAIRSSHCDLFGSRADGVRVLVGVRTSKAGLEGWMGAMEARGRAVWHSHDDRQSGVLPDGSGQSGVAGVARSVGGRLRGAKCRAARVVAAQNGQQPGDPAKLAAALIAIANEDPPPRRFLAGADVIALAQRKIELLQEDIESHRSLSESLTYDE